MKTKRPTPTLDRLKAEGKIWDEDGNLVGIASDGAVLCLGAAAWPESVERYLAAHPDPSDW